MQGKLSQAEHLQRKKRRRNKLTATLGVGEFVDMLTFELSLPGFGCQF